ncbi:MAG: hypothetical protein AAF004_03535 [Pseudomonadota bacterium]
MIKKFAAAFVVLFVFGYFALKYYVSYSVAKGVDNVIESLAGVATIRYGSVSSTMAGRLTIDDLTVIPQGLNDPITIDGVGIKLPNFFELMKLKDMTARSLATDGFPETFEVFINDARLNPDADYYAESMNPPIGVDIPVREDDPIGHCLLQYGFTPAVMAELGYDTVVLSMSYGFRQLADSFMLNFNYDLQDMVRMNIDMELQGRSKSIMQSANYRPMLVGATVEGNDLSLGSAMTRRCEDLGVTREDAWKAWLESTIAGLVAVGFVPDERLTEQLTTMATSQHGNFRVIADPSTPLDFNRMQYYKPEDMPALFGVELESW